MKKLKKYKTDLLIILLFSIIYIAMALLLTRGEYVFAAITDFPMQHYIFPEYFRNLFLKTKDLLPDFALNIGGGQNIYNFAYYGLLSPLILVSYILPQIPMFYYLIGMSFLTTISSAFLFYKFLIHKKIDNKTSLVVSLLFLFATPIMFHAKRHIMFVNYFPFLMLGLFGIDRYIEKKKSTLLTISTVLMILTSFYYSVAGIIVLIIYGIYCYSKEKNTIKDWLKNLLILSKPFIFAVLITAILWLPTAYTLLTGRGESINDIVLWHLLIPSFKSFYTAYAPGITLLEFILIGILVIDKKIDKNIRFLALTIIIIFLFPIFNYILNGTLYENAKSLIPFLPLALFLVAISLTNLNRHKKKIQAILLTTTCIISLASNLTDPLITKESIKESTEQEYKELVESITEKDQDMYRIDNATTAPSALNRVYSMDEYKGSVYSSTQNKEYQDWIKKDQKSNQFYRNNMMLTLSGNILTEAMMSEKYQITTETLSEGYKLIDENKDLKLYENTFALPMIYATKNQVSQKDYNKLQYPENVITSYTNKIEDWDLKTTDFKITDQENIEITKEDDTYTMDASPKNSLTLTPSTNLEDKIVFLSIKNTYNKSCKRTKTDQSITINGIKNKLTCRDWKYHNRNYTFHYVLVSPKELKVTFTEGKYKLTDISIIMIDKDVLLTAKDDITAATIDKTKTLGDQITATITVPDKQYLTVSIPYDKGFKITVDNKEVTYQENINNQISFSVEKGTHQIVITYNAPWKNIAVIISIVGILFLLINIWIENVKSCKRTVAHITKDRYNNRHNKKKESR